LRNETQRIFGGGKSEQYACDGDSAILNYSARFGERTFLPQMNANERKSIGIGLPLRKRKRRIDPRGYAWFV